MIVPMKEITVLVTKKEIENSLKKLRKLGVVHIDHINLPQGEELSKLESKCNQIDQLLLGIDDNAKEPVKQCDVSDVDIDKKISELLDLFQQEQDLINRQNELNKHCQWFDKWGDISINDLKLLNKWGIYVKLYRAEKKLFEEQSKEKLLYKIDDEGSTICCALITRTRKDFLEAIEIEIPQTDISKIREEINTVGVEINLIKERIHKAQCYVDLIKKYKGELQKQLEKQKVQVGMAYEEEFAYLQGYCPYDKVEKIEDAAKKQGWGIISKEPQDIQKVPTLIRYPKWVSIIDPVFKFMDTLPGYKEYDITPWFLLFFSLFFAMLIGDAGYGLVFLLLTLFAQKKMPHVPKTPFFLMYVLAGTTIFWGAITGTWFGAEGIAKLPIFNNLIIDKIYSYAQSSQMVLMYLCFVIGGVQLTIAHAMAAIRHSNSKTAIAQVGWISIIWGIFFLAGKLVLGNPFPLFAKYLLAAGVGLVLLFSSEEKNIVKGALLTLADLPLKLISCFGDTLSYIRLFAVGYASVMIAVSFNDMALGIGFNNIFTGLISAIILVVAHTFNIVLGLMSILVHGIRLNMLEFSGHLDMEWSGKAYTPFKE